MVTANDPGGLAGRYRAVFESMYEGFAICEAIYDRAGRLVDYVISEANPVYLKRAPGGDGGVGRRLSELPLPVAPGWLAACARALKGGEVRFEFKDPRSSRWYEVHMMRLSEREFGQLYVDVTERHAAAARQKELWTELNHRVKNNLAIVSAVLDLQARGAPAEAAAPLRAAVDRIRSIAELHTVLYQQGSPDELDLAMYLETLTERLGESLLPSSGHALERVLQPCPVSTHDAVSLGLIVNELVTNAVKYAFPHGRPGKVEIRLLRHGDQATLRVRDNGVGLSPDAVEGLGLRLVRSLCHGLGAELTLTSEAGLCAEICFPVSGQAIKRRSG